MKLYIKNMVCDRCKMVVKTELEQLQLHPVNVSLGEVDLLEEAVSPEQSAAIAARFQTLGFELIDDRKSRIIEKIKNVVVSMVHYEEAAKYKYSEVIAAALHHDYPYLSKLFSEVEGVTIEQYIILQKIERVKELLVYDELTLQEIADKTGYSSVPHLSNQFKKITGYTTSHFKKIKQLKRTSLDNVGKAGTSEIM